MRELNAKIDFVFDFKKKSSENKKGTIHLRIYNVKKKTRTYVSTNIQVYPNQWSDKYHIINHPQALQLNRMLDEKYNIVYKQVQEAVGLNSQLPTSERLRLAGAKNSFLDWLYEQIEKEDVVIGTRKHYRTMYKALEEYGQIKSFSDVTTESIKDFLLYINDKKRAMSVGCRHNYFKNFTKFIRAARDRKLLPYDILAGVHCKREKTADREHLTIQEIQKIIDTPIPSQFLARARDLFIIQCGTGLAYSDLIAADFKQVQNVDGIFAISGKRQKTKERYFAVILDFALPILERYNYVLPTLSNQKYNAFIKSVMEIVGIDKKVTSHVGRHTYACICLSQGIRIEVVQRTLGHKDIKTTQIYARLVDNDIINEFKSLKK